MEHRWPWALSVLALVFSVTACGNRDDGSPAPPPGAPEASLVGGWPHGALGEALAQRIRTRPLASGLPVLINATAVRSLDAESRETLRASYLAGQPIVVLETDQAAVESLAGIVGRRHGIVLNRVPTPIVGLHWRPGHSRDDFVLHTVSSGAELDREMQALLDWLPSSPAGAQRAAQAVGSSPCPDPGNLACLVDAPQQQDVWTDCVATWQVAATPFAFYACGSEQGSSGLYYVGMKFDVTGTVPSGYSWTEIVVPASAFDPAPSSLSLYSASPATTQTTTSVTTGTELTIGGGASFGASSDGPQGSLSFSASDSFFDETTTTIPSTDIQNLSSTETVLGKVLFQYQNFAEQCPGPYCYWAGHAPTCDAHNAECDSGYTSAINIQCDGNYPYECEYGSSSSDNTGGCGGECDSAGSGKNLCCPEKSTVQNCFTQQFAEYIWTFEPDSALSCADSLTITASFNDDWPPACSPSSPTTTEQGQCGPTFTTQFNSYPITYTIDLPAQCCSAECAPPAPASGQPTPTPVATDPPGGSWSESCVQTSWDGTTLCASCQNEEATCVPATCITGCAGEAANLDGVLTCS